jgi:hypothetical protein
MFPIRARLCLLLFSAAPVEERYDLVLHGRVGVRSVP